MPPQVSLNTIRISLFRLHPKAEYEQRLIDTFARILGRENFVSFKGIGHYDLICIYKQVEPHCILFGGAIEGIRSFSTIDCICWDSDDSDKIFLDLESKPAIAISLVALNPLVSRDNGGIRNQIICDIKEAHAKELSSFYYFNSFSWGEQVILQTSESISDLWEESRFINSDLLQYALDVHSVLGINLNQVFKWEEDINTWNESIPKEYCLQWDVALVPHSNALSKFRNHITSISRSISTFKVFDVHSSFSNNFLWLKIRAESWGAAIIGIRQIRRKAQDLFTSTKLKILKSYKKSKTPPDININYLQLTEPRGLPDDSCQIIRQILDDRVARLVVEAIYTVIDAYADFPSCYVIKNIVRAERQLIEMIIKIDTDIKFLSKMSTQQWHGLFQLEAESIIQATRQRVTGLPTTREYRRLPFELPPTNVRLFIESSEFLTDRFLTCLEQKSGPYVIIDTVDGPTHSTLSISLPEHRCLSMSTYVALTHESLHYHYQFNVNIDELLNKENFQKFFNQGKMYSHFPGENDNVRLIEEIIVELLDYHFSYLGNYLDYMEEEWNFFASHIVRSYKRNFDLKDLIPYLLRTFIPKLWDIVQADRANFIDVEYPEMPSLFIATSYRLRKSLREHIETAVTNGVKHYSDLNHFKNAGALVVQLASDLELMADVLDEVFLEIKRRIVKHSDLLADMKAVANGEYKEIADNIVNGNVVNRKIKYPHLIAIGVSKKSREKFNNDEKEDSRVTKTFLMSLWNSMNLEIH